MATTYNSNRQRQDSTSTDDSSSTRPSPNIYAIENGPRKIYIKKSETGFGFNVRGQVSEGGPLKLYNGEFYAPLQQVSAVLAGGAAELAGLNKGDRILSVNGVNVDGATHKQVVDLIKLGGDTLNLIVLSTPSDQIHRNRSDTNRNSDDASSNDYAPTPTTDRYTLKVTVPDFKEMITSQREKYIAFNINVSGTYTCSRRYKEFDMFHSLLKQEFTDFNFPSFPKKWPFKLSEQQLESRRNALENYLEKICSVRVIFETDLVKEFVCLNNYLNIQESNKKSNGINYSINMNNNNELDSTIINTSNNNDYSSIFSDKRISITSDGTVNSAHNPNNGHALLNGFDSNVKVKLPDNSIYTLTIKPNQTTNDVYANLVKNIKLDAQLADYFYLYEIIDETFERKLRPDDIPYSIHVQNYNTNRLLFRMKKWYFNLRIETVLAKNNQTLQYLFHQAIEDVERNQITFPDDIDIEFFRQNNRYIDYLRNISKLDGYGEMVFPHCPCNSRKQGHIIVVLCSSCLKLEACSREGKKEDQIVEFQYKEIDSIGVDDEEMAFVLNVKLTNKPNKEIKVFTGFYLYMYDCVRKALDECKELKKK